MRSQYPEIVQKTKQVFVHKIKDFLLQQSDQILIFAFVSLKMVAYYGNYTLVVGRLTMLFTTMMGGIVAGVGNLVAEGDKEKYSVCLARCCSRIMSLRASWYLLYIRASSHSFIYG